MCRLICSISTNAQKAPQKRSDVLANIVVKGVCSFLHDQGNKYYGTTSVSTCGNITAKNMESVFAKISQLNGLQAMGLEPPSLNRRCVYAFTDTFGPPILNGNYCGD